MYHPSCGVLVVVWLSNYGCKQLNYDYIVCIQQQTITKSVKQKSVDERQWREWIYQKERDKSIDEEVGRDEKCCKAEEVTIKWMYKLEFSNQRDWVTNYYQFHYQSDEDDGDDDGYLLCTCV